MNGSCESGNESCILRDTISGHFQYSAQAFVNRLIDRNYTHGILVDMGCAFAVVLGGNKK